MTTRTQTLAMIASALNPIIPAVRAHNEHISYHNELAELEATPDRKGLIFMMADGTQFKITLEEMI